MKENKALLSLACGGMELSWRYAWGTFLTTSIIHHPFPLPEAIGAFVLAALLTSLHTERGWRVITVLCLQMLGFIPAALRIIHVFDSWSRSFLSHAYQAYSASFGDQGIPEEWLIVLLVLFWAFFFWGGGVGLAKRSKDYSTTCSRFDLGLGAFFFLFLIKAYLLIIKVGSSQFDPAGVYLLFAFFIFGLLAVGLARNQSAASVEPKDFLPGYQGIGVILSFIMLVLLIGGGIVLFALPYLTAAAQTGYGVLKSGSAPLLNILMQILHFIFGGDDDAVLRPKPQPVKKMTKGPSYDLHNRWLQIIGEILVWVFWVLLGLVLLTILCAFLYSLFQWLFSKTAAGEKKQSPWHLLLSWAARWHLFLISLQTGIVRAAKSCRSPVQIYAALLRWGRNSGLPRFLSETPTEYGLRLRNRFPLLERKIELIIEAFNKEVYGEIILSKQQLDMTKSAWSGLRSPLHWPRRLKTRFFRYREQDDSFPQQS